MCDIATSYSVLGMTCDSCATKIKSAVRDLPGVTGLDVDLAAATLTVTGHVDGVAVESAIESAGYRLAPTMAQQA